MDATAGMERTEAATDPRASVEETSAAYLTRWSRLVSTTNWEKGRIIFEWRSSLCEAGAPVQTYSDEAWSRRVGSVSSQHVGRLRRVYERFADQYEQYPGLYWSHFQAALDWDDAEMWLEGGAQSGWSVSQMRSQRWEALGAPPELKPRDEDIVTAEFDEDSQGEAPPAGSIAPSTAEVRDMAGGEESESDLAAESERDDRVPVGAEHATAAPPLRPFEDLPPLPDDLADAVEAMKLAIVQHKLAGWVEISRDDVLRTLDALKQLAVSPREG